MPDVLGPGSGGAGGLLGTVAVVGVTAGVLAVESVTGRPMSFCTMVDRMTWEPSRVCVPAIGDEGDEEEDITGSGGCGGWGLLLLIALVRRDSVTCDVAE